MEKKLIYSWKFLDKKNRGKLWYIIAISIVLGLSIWGIITKQYGLSFIVILAAGIYFFVDNNSNDVIEVYISEEGINAGDTFYDFSRISSYSIVYDGEIAVFLRLKLNKRGISNVDISIDNDVLQNLKEILPNFLQQGENEEITAGDKIINYLKL